ncbi:hypothetical protein Ae201684P_018898 [Aphanomyces euteiches]|uniref:Uncharacterized protein n=1 Tax=Aphanomyces euteiches TaxID=100861 RepID=A0A6G0WZN2_9STRA|nr:hypothetical protein Ae201684_010079 [Aphanomyces euteiches]KAH9099890.1 hypothetical protein Ae201684P_018898 [Aphanomyces euteiches]
MKCRFTVNAVGNVWPTSNRGLSNRTWNDKDTRRHDLLVGSTTSHFAASFPRQHKHDNESDTRSSRHLLESNHVHSKAKQKQSWRSCSTSNMFVSWVVYLEIATLSGLSSSAHQAHDQASL